MNTPTRRPVKLRNVLGNITNQLARTTAEIELGWSVLLDELHDAGWPARMPDDDRRPHSGDRAPSEAADDANDPSVLDYADPTGELALRLNHLHGDRETLEDHRRIIEISLGALEQITRRHRPPSVPAIPACSLTTCCEPVESRRLNDGSLSYVGMVQIAGNWVAKSDVRPLCSRHRKSISRSTRPHE